MKKVLHISNGSQYIGIWRSMGFSKNVIPQLCSIKIFILKSMYSQLSPNIAKSLPESCDLASFSSWKLSIFTLNSQEIFTKFCVSCRWPFIIPEHWLPSTSICSLCSFSSSTQYNPHVNALHFLDNKSSLFDKKSTRAFQ